MTPTQGERAQTALAHELFAAAQLAPGEGIEDAVSRIAAALTAAPSVSDGQRALHESILNRLSHAELLEKAHYLMELNSNQARTIGELQDLVETAPAQPAAPQGVAYAALEKKHRDFVETVSLMLDAIGYKEDYARQWPKEKASITFKRWFDEQRASNGQAPVGAADDDEVDLPDAEDMARSALQEALSFGLSHDVIYRWMRAIQDQTVKAMRTPTAQAAPAAGAVAGPGWKLVPVVVTNEMWQAYKRPSGKSGDWSFAQRYTAMIAAAPTPAAKVDALTQAARDVLAERQRQTCAEGWTPEHDDEHQLGELSQAAACYASQAFGQYGISAFWPWAAKWWKPSQDPRRNLEKAGALILAEMERIDRTAHKQGGA